MNTNHQQLTFVVYISGHVHRGHVSVELRPLHFRSVRPRGRHVQEAVGLGQLVTCVVVHLLDVHSSDHSLGVVVVHVLGGGVNL